MSNGTQPSTNEGLASEHGGKTARRSFLRYTGAAAGLGLAGCIGYGDSDDSDPGTPVIGSNHPLTGPIAYTGERMHQAVELAADIKNEQGGIESMDGAEVEVVKGDNQGQQELGSEVAQQLVDEGASVTTGCFSSPVTEDATRVAESEQTPFVISAAVDARILQETPLEYVYRPQPSSDRMAANHVNMLTDVLAENNGEHDIELETAGLFYLDNSYGQSIRNGLRDSLSENGIEVVEEAAINFGQTAETQVTQFRDADPDTIIATTFESQTVELINAMQNQDYWPPLLSGVANAAFANPEAMQDIGDIVNGEWTTGYSVDRSSEHGREIAQRYEEEYGTVMDNNVGMAYGAAEVIIEAFEQAGTADTEELNETLKDIEVSEHILAMPAISFRDDGENENATANLKQIQDFEPRIVRPDEYSQTEPQF
jgi:branched-chain amino acid transport system substrate-binding protein